VGRFNSSDILKDIKLEDTYVWGEKVEMGAKSSKPLKIIVGGRQLKNKSLRVLQINQEEFEISPGRLRFNILALRIRTLRLEYASLDPKLVKLVRILIAQLINEGRVLSLDFVFINLLGREYTITTNSTESPMQIRIEGDPMRPWISRLAMTIGVVPHNLSHSIEYDFIRLRDQFPAFIWDASFPTVTQNFRSRSVKEQIKAEVNLNDINFLELKNSRIMHGNIVVVGDDYFPVDRQNSTDDSWPSNTIYNESNEKYYFNLIFEERHIGDAIFLGSSSSWFHFLIEVFPRYLHVGTSVLKNRFIILGADSPRQIVNLAKDLNGLDPLLLGPATSAEVTDLITCQDFRFSETLNFSERHSDLMLVRKYMLEKYASTSSKPETMLLIKRQGNLFRRTSNFKEIEFELQNLGFISIDPGALSISEQVNLFAQSKVIVAETGAALTSLMFCHHETFVVELNTHNLDPGFWAGYASAFGIEVTMIQGKGAGNKGEIDCQALLTTLEGRIR
jgi:hypothetical protein